MSKIDTEIKEAEIEKLRQEKKLLEYRAGQARIALESMRHDQKDRKAGSHNNRIYNFFGRVDHTSASAWLETLAFWARRDPKCHITVVFNSPGGSVIDGLALYDEMIALRDSGHKITTVARGMAASMGAVLLQAGDERIIGKNAHMLIHQISYGAIGSFGEIEDEVAFAKQLQDRLLDILAERSTLSKQKIKNRWERKNWWLGSEDVLDLGFADSVG